MAKLNKISLRGGRLNGKRKGVLGLLVNVDNILFYFSVMHDMRDSTPQPPFGTLYTALVNKQHLACSAGVFFERAICSRKRHVETSRREEEMGLSQRP